MTPLEELENQVAAAQAIVDDLDVQLTNPKLTEPQFDDLLEKRNDADDTLTDLTGKRDKLKKTQGATETNLKSNQDFAKNQIDIFESRYEKALKEFNKNPSSKGLAKGYSTRDKLKDAGKNLNNAYDAGDAVGLKVPRIIEGTEESGFVFVGQQPVAATTGTQPTTAGGRTLTAAESKAAATGRTLEEPTGVAPVDGEDVAETVVTDKTVPPTDAAGKRKAYVDAQLVTQKLEDTPANRKKLREEFNATQPAGKTTVVDTAWESTFKEKFPSKAWLLTEIDRAKYPQLFSTIQNAITTKMYDSTTGLALFEEQLKGTDFFKEISTSGKVQEIKKLVGNLGFDTTDFVQFVNTSINFGWTGDKLKQETYKNAFDVDPDTGKYLNPNAVARVRASADYISTQNIAKQFFNMNPSEKDVLNVLTGVQTAADYEMQQREFVKNIESYKHLAPLLDLGLTMTGIADRYRKTAANLLEVDENSIDMSTANYEQALTYNDNGKMRLMTNGEWEKLLRTDPRYKWEFTNNAKSEARSLSSNIAQALGKVV